MVRDYDEIDTVIDVSLLQLHNKLFHHPIHSAQCCIYLPSTSIVTCTTCIRDLIRTDVKLHISIYAQKSDYITEHTCCKNLCLRIGAKRVQMDSSKSNSVIKVF